MDQRETGRLDLPGQKPVEMVAGFLQWPEDGGDDPHGKSARRAEVDDVEFSARSQDAPHLVESRLPSWPFEMVQDQAGKDPVE